MFFKAEHFVRNLRDNKRFCPCRAKCLCFAYPHVPLRVCFYAFWALRFLFLHNSRAESPKALSSGQSISVAPSEAIPHYFRTVRAKALNKADFWQTKSPICPTETPFRKNKTASYFANSPFYFLKTDKAENQNSESILTNRRCY